MRALLVTLGGADYPRSPELQHAAFEASHRTLVDLLTDPEAPLVAADDALDLFNDSRSWPEQLIALRDWLKAAASHKNGSPPTELIIHYVGHGAFKPNSVDYYLTINMTDEEVPAETSISLTGLHRVLLKHAHKLRVIIIIDACFAAAAWRHLQSGEIEAKVKAQVGEILESGGTAAGGLAVLCSSEKYETSSALGKEGLTQFGDALTTALRTGCPGGAERLSLSAVLDLMVEMLRNRYDDPVKPVLLSPRKGSEAVDKCPLFPNRARKETAPYLESVSPEIRERLRAVVAKFVDELAAAVDEAEISHKLDQIAAMGRKQLADAATPRARRVMTSLSEEIAWAERTIKALNPGAGRGGISLRRLYYLFNPAQLLLDYANTLARTPEPAALINSLASVKEELSVERAYFTTDQADLVKRRHELEQMYCIAHELTAAFQDLVERTRASRPSFADMVTRRAIPFVTERSDLLADAIKSKEREAARLADAKAAQGRTSQALEQLIGALASGFAEAQTIARTRAELAREKKRNPALEAELEEIFTRMRAVLANLRQAYDKARGAEPQ